jgi:hypothetical protein
MHHFWIVFLQKNHFLKNTSIWEPKSGMPHCGAIGNINIYAAPLQILRTTEFNNFTIVTWRLGNGPKWPKWTIFGGFWAGPVHQVKNYFPYERKFLDFDGRFGFPGKALLRV